MLLICVIGMEIIYAIELPFFERYKVSSEPWPWQSDPKEWKELKRKSFLLVGFNSYLLSPVVLYFLAWLKNFETDYLFEYEKLPNTFEIMASITLFMMLEDLAFHLFHRLLHNKYLYPYIHKIHH